MWLILKTSFHQFLTEKASSGLWENIILTIDGTILCVMYTGARIGDHKGNHVYPCQWPVSQQEPGEIPATPHMGWGPSGHPFPPPLVIHHCPHCCPQWAHTWRDTNVITLVSMVLPWVVPVHPFLHFGTSVHYTYTGVIYGNYRFLVCIAFSHRLDEAFSVRNEWKLVFKNNHIYSVIAVKKYLLIWMHQVSLPGLLSNAMFYIYIIILIAHWT